MERYPQKYQNTRQTCGDDVERSFRDHQPGFNPASLDLG